MFRQLGELSILTTLPFTTFFSFLSSSVLLFFPFSPNPHNRIQIGLVSRAGSNGRCNTSGIKSCIHIFFFSLHFPLFPFLPLPLWRRWKARDIVAEIGPAGLRAGHRSHCFVLSFPFFLFLFFFHLDIEWGSASASRRFRNS